MIEFVNIKDIKPAKYNPRKISDEQFTCLQASIKKLGFCLPILVNSKNDVIVAGHQRTKAAQKVGIDKVPCCFVDKLEYGDEIKFNQLHNAIEYDSICKGFYTDKIALRQYVEVEANIFSITGQTASCVKEICKLILKYGNVLCAILSNGSVIVGHNYIFACQLLNIKANVYRIDNSLETEAKKYLNDQYGKYSYEHLEKHTYVQGLAQMFRLTGAKKQNRSSLYEGCVLPYMANHKAESLLDFGCGKAAYVQKLKQSGTEAVGIEFYNNNGKSIDVKKGNEMIDELCQWIDKHGAFDVVVCDSVLNSVDSKEAENSVMACCNLFTKNKLFISGRTLKSTNRESMKKDCGVRKRYIEYLDDDNFSANYRQGNFYYQHFHSKDGAIKLVESIGFKVIKYTDNSTSWQIIADKVESLPVQQYIDALTFEFNLPLPNGRKYNRQHDIIKACETGMILNAES